jgi:Do/DeqQ family serine protease
MMLIYTAHRRKVFAGMLISMAWLVVWLLGVPVTHAQTGAGAQGAMDLTTTIRQVAKQTIPAVVHIEVTERQTVPNPFSPFEQEPSFRYFFDLPRSMPKQFKREVKGIGTGMLMDAQGHILTNHHVVGGATKIDVLLANGHTYPARLVGADPKTDLAVVKIEAKEALPSVTFGDSDAMEVGEWVVAIGHPRGLDQTVTHGIISAKHRRGISDPSSYQDFLQTDAAINPGNSGGPLLNLRGEVIGVNAAIASQTGGFEGIGFAIPSNMAISVARALIAHGKVDRAWLGVSVQDVTPELARSMGLEERKGALVAEVVKGGPAEQAGLRQGDVVIAYGDKDMADASALRNAVAATPVGHEVKVTVLRGGQKHELTAKVQNLAEANKALLAAVETRLGVAVHPVTSQEAERYGLEPHQGVTITQVAPKGAMGKAGLEVQDILLAIDGQPIANVESLAALTAALQPQQRITVLALDHRSGNTGDIEVVIR